MVNNYLKMPNGTIHFFDDRNERARWFFLYVAREGEGVVYRRPFVTWLDVPAVGDGIGELSEEEPEVLQ